MSHLRIGCAAFVAGVAIAIAFSTSEACAAEPDVPLRFRRVLVPESDLDQQVRGLLPLKRREFETRIEEAVNGGLPGTAPAVRIDSGQTAARLENDVLIGQSSLSIVSPSGSPSGSRSVLLLAPWNLALKSAVWEGDAAAGAKLGTAPDGRLLCLVDRSGALGLSWSSAGRSGSKGELAFDLEWPSITRHEIRLELPKGHLPTVEGGLVTKSAGNASGASMSLWVVQCSGSRLSLRIAAQPSRPGENSPLLVKERTSYTVHDGSVEVQSTFVFDAPQQSLPLPILSLDPALQLLDVRQGDESLPWSALAAVNGRPRVAVSARSSPLGGAEPIEVSGIFFWNSRSKAKLPRIEIVGGAWQEGQISVTAGDSLQLQALPVAGVRQTAFTPSSAGRSVDVWQFQKFLSDAVIEIQSPGDGAAVTELSGTLLRMDSTQVAVVYRSHLEIASGRKFELEAAIPRAWIVDAVDVTPADMLADRTLQSRGGGPQTLRLSLRRPAAEGRPVDIVVRAHRQRLAGEQELPADLFQMVRWNDLRSSRRLVACHLLDAAAELSFTSGSDVRRLDPAALPPGELALFDSPPGPLLWETDHGADPPRASFVPTSPRFAANVVVRAELDSRQIREHITVDCVPEASSIGRLQVRCSPAPASEMRWRMVGEESRELVVRRIDDPEASADEAVYEIALQRPRQTPFRIEAQTTRGRRDPDSLTLASVVAAAAHSSQTEIRAGGNIALLVDAEGLGAIPPADLPAKGGLPLRGIYRYDPARSARLQVRQAPSGRSLPLAWVESLDLISSWNADGAGQHEALCIVHGMRQVRASFQLPPQASAVRATLDGQPASNLESSSVPGHYSLSLPAAGRAAVRLSYVTHDQAPGWAPWGAFSSPIPICDLPVLVTRWRVFTAPSIKLWSGRAVSQATAEVAGSLPSVEFADWHRYDVEPAVLPGNVLRVYRPLVLQTWSWCLALAAAGVVMCWGAGRLGVLMLLTGVAAVVALLGPSEFALPGLSALAGLALGGAAVLLAPQWKVREFPGRQPGAGTAAAATVALSLWLPLAIGYEVRAQEAAGENANNQGAPWRRVVIPVDDKRQPVGDYVFLEPELYDGLVSLTERAAVQQPDWLLGSCEYRPALTHAEDATGPRLDEVAAVIEVETFVPDAVVALGFQRTQVHLLERRARLDGSIVLPEWSTDGSQLTVQMGQPGKHRLELAFGAIAKAEGANVRLEMDVPRTARSRVVLSKADERCDVSSAVGGVARDNDGQRSVDLGPTGHLTLVWPASESDRVAAASTEVEQLLLWKIRAGSVVADARLLVRPLGGPIRELAIDLDPRLRPLPPAAGQAVVRQWIEEGSLANILHLEFREPIEAETRVTVSLLWAEATGVGNLVLPQLSVLSGVTRRDWMALSLSANLQWKSRPAVRLTDPSADEFVRVWGEPLAGEITVLDNALPSPLMVTEPTQARVVARQALDCSVSPSSAWIRSTLDLSGLPPHALQHVLKATPGLSLTDVKVFEGNQPVRIRWSQDGEGLVRVTQFVPPAAEQRWEISGHVPLARSQPSQSAPLVSYVGAAEGSLVFRVYRRSDARLTVVADQATWSPMAAAPVGEHVEGLGRLASAWRTAELSDLVSPSLAVSANEPEPSGYVLTRLMPGESEWRVAIDVHVESPSAELDALRIQTPATLAGPLSVAPTLPHKLVSLPGQTSQVLEIRPERAIEGQLHLTITGRVREGDVDAVTLPVVTLLDAPGVRHFAALPVRSDAGPLEWQTSGLQAVDPIDIDLTGSTIPKRHELFEVTAPRVVARAQVQNSAAASPSVRLADHRVIVCSPTQLVGSTSLDIVPRGAQHFELALPTGMRLVYLVNEGIPFSPTYLGASRWRVPTISDRLPQRVELVYTAALPPEAARRTIEFRPPGLAGKTLQSLWSVRHARHASLSEIDASPARQVERIEALADVLEQVAAVLEQDPAAPATVASFSTWSQRLQLLQDAMPASSLPPELSSRYQAAVGRAETARARVGTAEIFATAPGSAPNQDHVAASQSDIRFVETDGGLGIRIQASRWMFNSPRAPFDSHLVWACGTFMAACLLSLGRIRAFLGRSVPVVIGLLGVSWLALGSAPWMGWLIVAIAVWLSIRWPWPRTSFPSLSSFIRPSV